MRLEARHVSKACHYLKLNVPFRISHCRCELPLTWGAPSEVEICARASLCRSAWCRGNRPLFFVGCATACRTVCVGHFDR